MEQSYNGPERRKFKRVKVNFTLIYRAGLPLSTSIAIDGNNANSNISIGTHVMLRFTLIDFSVNNDERVNNMDMTAKVVSNEKVSAGECRLGIQFTQISHEDKNVIAEFVKNKEPFA
jgi:hypothetical protein